MMPRVQRIGLIGPLPPPAGGMANQTRQLKELLEGEGLFVHLVQVNAPYRPAWLGRIKGVRALLRMIPYLFALWRCAGQVQLFHVMANSGWSWHLFAAPAIWIARMRGIPVVVNYRGGEAKNFLSRSRFWVLPSLTRASALIVPSGFLKEVFAAFGVEAEIVPNVVDLSRFHPAAGVPAGGDVPHIVVTRNLEPIYDVGTAIQAFAAVRVVVPAAVLTIAGSGPERTSLEELVRQLELGDAVKFTGRLDRNRMADLYRAASLMVNPSLVDNAPNSILEAMASGVPVVSTHVGGVPYLVTDGASAILVPPGNPSAMAAAILRILQERELAQALRDTGLEDVRQYTWLAVSVRLFAIYNRLCTRSVAG